MPTFCRHNRLLHHCPICAREQHVELTPVISPGSPRTGTGQRDRPKRASDRAGGPRESRTGTAGGSRQPGAAARLQVRRLERGADDGYRVELAPGLRSSVEAERLADELAFAATRLGALSERPPGLYAEVAGPGDVEERVWLAFLIAYLCPLDEEDPFAAVRAVRTPWRSPELPDLHAVRTGPRSAHDSTGTLRTLEAYRAWAGRGGSQAAAFTGDPGWTPERRFTRVFERLALPGLHRDVRFDLLVTLGCLGLFALTPGQLIVGGTDEVTVGAKRVLGIGERFVLEGRAAALARACALPLAALDLGLYNWQRGQRASVGLGPGAATDEAARARARAALEL
ncbi:MAG: hypothetical protein JO240_17290 [Solirubrobacterales bacterium]|nr:hypothetical protein [Solirubrobacterales bacterium]